MGCLAAAFAPAQGLPGTSAWPPPHPTPGDGETGGGGLIFFFFFGASP